jgi:tRNA(adenine34) deaminase
MFLAIQQAKIAYENNEVPVGAVIVRNDEVIGIGCNGVISMNSVSAHAEIIAINNAAKVVKNYRLIGCSMYVSLEPCHMCAKAIVDARISKLFFAAREPKTGSIISIDNFLDADHLNHKVRYDQGDLENESAKLLSKFFKSKRN